VLREILEEEISRRAADAAEADRLADLGDESSSEERRRPEEERRRPEGDDVDDE
jgi:hypothetical protein